jgi:hypothetical protein
VRSLFFFLWEVTVVLLGLALWFLGSADFCVGVRSEQGFGSTMIVE